MEDARIDAHATALADAIEATLPGWVERSVRRRVEEAGRPVDATVAETAAAAGIEAAEEVGRAVRSLLERDVDEQPTTPLSLLRGAVRYPTAVLHDAGVPPVERDEVQERLFPDDLYDLTPASFADVDPAIAEPGLNWGAAKAFVHIQRHRPPREQPSRPESQEPQGPQKRQEEPMRKIVAYVPDLMDRSKVAAAADVTFVNQPSELADAATVNGADLVVVDVTRPGVVEALPDIPVPVLGFSKHTNREAIDAALAAGAERVLARSAFFAHLDDLLADSAPETAR